MTMVTEQEQDQELPERWSAKAKTEVVLRLLRGEAVEAVSREIQVPAHEIEAWRQRFLEGRGGSSGGPVRPACWASGDGADACDGGPHLELDPEAAQRWFDALEHAAARQAARRAPHDGGAGLAEGRDPAASEGALYGLRGSRLRGESGGHPWALSAPAPTCGRLLCR